MSTIRKFVALSKLIHLRPWLFITSVVLAQVASLGDVCSMALLIPVLNLIAAKTVTLPFVPWFQPREGPWQGNLDSILLLLLLILGCVAFTAVCEAASGICLGRFAVGFVSLARRSIYQRLLSFGKGFFDRTDLSLQLWVLLDGTAELGAAVFELRPVVVCVVLGISLLLFLVVISWQLTLLVLALLPLVYFPANWLTRKIQATSMAGVTANIDLRAYAQDMLANIALVKAHATEDHEFQRFSQKVQRADLYAYSVYKKAGMVEPLGDLMSIVALLAVIVLGLLVFLRSGALSVGVFVVYFYVLRRCVGHLRYLGDGQATLARMAPLLDRVLWVFDDNDKTALQDGTVVFEKLRDKISFHDVSFEYAPNMPVLQHVDFSIQKGSTVALIGRTGAGKSTLAHLLCRFYDCSSGRIEVDGTDLRDFTSRSLRQKIAIVSQDVLLLNDTVRNNLVYGLRREVSPEELGRVARQARLQELIDNAELGYETVLGDRGVRLSGGEKQRLSIARALLADPDILILDEATSALDSETEKWIQEAIEELMSGRTVLAIAHRQSTIQKADWVIALEEGKVFAQAPQLRALLDADGCMKASALLVP